MKNRRLQSGFSLVEVMMAAGILAVGLVMIAGTFPVAIFLTAASVEQTIAPIVADEAFVKIQLYGIQFGGTYGLPANTDACVDFNDINGIKTAIANINSDEYLYPSVNTLTDRVYNWSAICRRVNLNDGLVQVTVFVSRKMGSGLKYPDPSGGTVYPSWPTPVRVDITAAGNYITDGCTVVADASGNIYRVLDHSGAVVTFDRAWAESTNFGWVAPPPTSGGRSPVVGVYQRIIRF